jgi:sugar (pentulose or hexulose) kinase
LGTIFVMNLYLGIDFGTSGARAIAIDSEGTIQAEVQYPFDVSASGDLATSWQTALFGLVEQISPQLRREVRAIAIDGTSSTVLLCNNQGKPVVAPILYNDGRGVEVMDRLSSIAPPNHTVLSATSSLAKLLWLCRDAKFCFSTDGEYFLHQADWLAFLLHGQLGISDYHNALKLGYDVEHLYYPQWLQDLQPTFKEIVLPKVLPPGTPVTKIRPDIATQLGFPQDCLVHTGTTDSIAAFLASGATAPGEAVTSLGSTLVLKLLSRTRVDDAHYGIYSHRLGDLWLVGGASNTGGAVLRHFFTDAELATLSLQIDASQESQLDYYPLLKQGDRFPINDPHLPPQLEPRPNDPVEFLHGLLESIARIEAQGYRLLQQLGATPLTHVYTAGGGAKNSTWTAIRARHLQVPLLSATQTEAAYGTALLALRGS